MLKIRSIDDLDVRNARVLLRVDINCPLDGASGAIADDSRLQKSLPTIRDLVDRGARLVLIAHQGDTLDYHNLASLRNHAERLTELLGQTVGFIDDIAGPAARQAIVQLAPGEILLLENLRFLTEEVSTFETAVKLTAAEMTQTYLVRGLAPLFDYYVNDAFAAAHRNSPSMVAFQELLPTAAGRLLAAELEALDGLKENPARPCVFLLGGLKISDAFGMMERILSEGVADSVLTSGIVGQIMLMADGVDLGEPSEDFIRDRSLHRFIGPAAAYLAEYRDVIRMPLDVACDISGERREFAVTDLPAPAAITDIGPETIALYREIVEGAATLFVNGPAGVYESEVSEVGTRALWSAVAEASGSSVIGGGDTVASARRFISLDDIDLVSTGGGALIRYLSGMPLPLVEAMQQGAERDAARPGG
ncbi:MAG: phosphoglycerate kinase [Acidimicrobiia bacterium]